MTRREPRIPASLVPSLPDRGARFVHEVDCEECHCGEVACRVMPRDLESFVAQILLRHSVPEEEAGVAARVLVAADVRGIPAHGVARLPLYLAGIKQGTIRVGVKMTVTEPCGTIGLVDANNGLGQVAGELGMRTAIRKAEEHGVGLVTVRNSNHFGIAGHYAMLAVDAGLVGISMSNAAPLLVPTHGAEPMLGTNPIAMGAPAIKNPPFLLDMALTVAPQGRIEARDRSGEPMPLGWAVDEEGFDTTNPGKVLGNLIAGLGGGSLPLGGSGEQLGGHKGYGLAMMVDILAGVLSGAAFGPDVDDIHGKPEAGRTAFSNIGHFFVAIDIARFMPLHDFIARLDSYVTRLKASRKAGGQEAVLVHGEKEHAVAHYHEEAGVPLCQQVQDALLRIAAGTEIAPPPRLPASSASSGRPGDA